MEEDVGPLSAVMEVEAVGVVEVEAAAVDVEAAAVDVKAAAVDVEATTVEAVDVDVEAPLIAVTEVDAPFPEDAAAVDVATILLAMEESGGGRPAPETVK